MDGSQNHGTRQMQINAPAIGTRQRGKVRVNLSGAHAGGLAAQRGPALAWQGGPSSFRPHQAAKPLPKPPATWQLVAPKLLSGSAWSQPGTNG